MASAEDWVKGTQLNLWEARRLNTGIRKGEVEHKYDYNVLLLPDARLGLEQHEAERRPVHRQSEHRVHQRLRRSWSITSAIST